MKEGGGRNRRNFPSTTTEDGFTCFVMPDVVNNYSWASAYTFSLAPLCIILPVILLLSLAVPLLCLHFLRKGSIRQRMADYDFK